MPKSPFPNYLRTIRKRSGLSQDEVAFLLGSPSGGVVLRYERFNRSPSLETACALETLFGIPMKKLFAGTFAKIGRRLERRARVLEKRLKTPDALAAQKLNTLRSISLALDSSPQL